MAGFAEGWIAGRARVPAQYQLIWLTGKLAPDHETIAISAKTTARPSARCAALSCCSAGKAMTVRRSTVEHPFGIIKCWMGATHFLCITLPKVATEMALNVLAYNMKRVMNIMGVDKLLEAMRAVMAKPRSIFARVRLLLDELETSQAAIWADMVVVQSRNERRPGGSGQLRQKPRLLTQPGPKG